MVADHLEASVLVVSLLFCLPSPASADDGGQTNAIIGVVVVSSVVAVVICCCQHMFNKLKQEDQERQAEQRVYGDPNYSGPRTTVCYLCLMRINQAQWNNGSHRRVCARDHFDFLRRLPMPFAVNCPRCRRKLKLWPDQGPPFTCDGRAACPAGPITLSNRGNNRFNCFYCDYDLCGACVHRQVVEEQQQQQPQQQQPQTHSRPQPQPTTSTAPNPFRFEQPRPTAPPTAAASSGLTPPPSYEAATGMV